MCFLHLDYMRQRNKPITDISAIPSKKKILQFFPKI